MLDQQAPHRLKGMRNVWELTQDELMTLLGGKDRSNFSRIERAERWPGVHVLVASTILFERSIEYLFKGLFDTIEENVLREAYLLTERLAEDHRPQAKRTRDRLTQVIQTIIDRHKQPGV